MGSSDERASQLGTGNRERGSDIRLEYYDRTHEDKSLPFFGRDACLVIIDMFFYLRASN